MRLLLLCLLLVPAPLQGRPDDVLVERVDIRGNRRIPEDTIRFYIQSRPGERYDEGRLALDLRALFKSNFFEYIEIDEKDGETGKIVTFILREKPLIRSIEYAGAKSFTESNILEHFKDKKVGLTVDSQYDPAKVRTAEKSLRDLMQLNGKPLGTVRTEVTTVPPSGVRVRFVLDEGPKVRIGAIRFTGNTKMSDGALKNALKLTKERNLISLFKGTDKFHAGKLEADIEMNLKAFYKENGYMQVQVGQPMTRIYEGPRGFTPMLRKTRLQYLVELPVEAGDQFRLGDLTLKDCGALKCDALTSLFGLKKGDVVNFKRIKDALEEIKKIYGGFGFINWSYIPEQDFDQAARTMNLTFTFQPDKMFSVHRINFSGNTKTRDRVMRREFLLEEGKPFSSRLLDISVLRLNQLGFFDKIEEKDYELKTNDKDASVDINLKVKEKSQQSIGMTGGVSGISGSFLGVNYGTNNFLGRGESLEVSVTGGTRSADLMLSYTMPYFLNTRWTMGISAYKMRYRYDTYTMYGLASYSTGHPVSLFTQHTTGATLTVGRPLGNSFWRLGASYTYQSIGIGGIAAGYESFALGQLVGSTPNGNTEKALSGIIRSEISPSLSYNTTNSYFMPTRGKSLNIAMGIAGGVLTGDYKILRPSAEYRQFIPDRWISHRRNTLGFRLMGQYIRSYGGSTIPFYERFFVGGETTLRGFDLRSISPIAISSTYKNDLYNNTSIDPITGLLKIDKSVISIGGDSLVLGSGEYRMPIAGPLSMSLFADVGVNRVSHVKGIGKFGETTVDLVGATNTVLRSSTGLEIQFMLPMVNAPFRLIFAVNPNRWNGDIALGTNVLHAHEPSHDIKFTIGRTF
jgi:outer membrane protein insertion porin family